ncbi:MAG: DNA primase [Firmicutes bacterium]|nr:DNA primase [Bacillota bacterium]
MGFIMTFHLSPLQIDEILRRLDIVETIGRYVSLKPSGKNFKGVCPFHPEKTPSLMVSPEKNLWHCFGCGLGGNAFSFVMKAENITFPEAAKILAERAGVSIELSYKNRKEISEKETLFSILDSIAKFYHQSLLNSNKAKTAREYLSKRGISGDSIKTFKLGFSPPDDELVDFLKKNNISLETALKTGTVTRRAGENYHDYFRGRIIFPIHDTQGRMMAFGGRVMTDSQPKYLNSPETAVFSKGKNLYGLNLARGEMGKTRDAIIVEGYIDLIALHQNGIKNSVASLGTSLTKAQAELLSRYCDNVIMAYDSDTAGTHATSRGVEIIEETGIPVKILLMPKGTDPDSFIKKEGVLEFRKKKEKAISFIEFKARILSQNFDLKSPEGKAGFVREIIPALTKIKDPVRRDEYIKRISQKLDVREEILRHLKISSKEEKAETVHLGKIFGTSGAELHLIKIMLHYPEVIPEVRKVLEPENFNERELIETVKTLYQIWADDHRFDSADFAKYINDEKLLSKITGWLLSQEPPFSQEAVSSLIKSVKDQELKSKMKDLEKEIQAMLSSGCAK